MAPFLAGQLSAPEVGRHLVQPLGRIRVAARKRNRCLRVGEIVSRDGRLGYNDDSNGTR